MIRRSLSLTALMAATIAGGVIESDASAAPGDLRSLDPKSGLPKTWDSQVGRARPVPATYRGVRGRRPAPPPGKIDPCLHFTKAACADPTFTAKCPNAAQACSSHKELDACAANPPKDKSCAQAFYDAHKTQLDAVPKARRIVPSRRSLGTETKPAAFVKYDPTAVKVGGMDHAFATRLAHPAARQGAALPVSRGLGGSALGGAPPALRLTKMQTAMKKANAFAAGRRGDVSGGIDSCDEYGARKYLQMTQFDDVVSANQRDPRKTYDLVFNSPQWAGVVNKAQVKDSEGAVSTTAPFASLDRMGNLVITPEKPLVFKPVQEPRNLYLAAAMGFSRTFSDPDPFQTRGTRTARTVPLPSLGFPDLTAYAQIQTVFDDYQKKAEVFYNQEFFARRPVTVKDAEPVNETFDWHKTKNAALWELDTEDKPGRYTDEELRIRYDKQRDLAALLAQRNELTDFVTNVSAICRHKTERGDPPKRDDVGLNKQSAGLIAIAARLSQNPGLAGTAEYFAMDTAFAGAGIGKGWLIQDPITKYSFTLNSGTVAAQPGNPNGMFPSNGGGFLYFSPGCHSQTGCPSSPIPVTLDEIKSRAMELAKQAMDAGAYNATIPTLKADAHKAFVQAEQASSAKCTELGIPNKFPALGGTIPWDSFDTGVAPPLTAAEQTIVAASFKNHVLPKIEAIDGLVYEQLNSGIELGCFAHGLNGCDWSPSRLTDFVHSYRQEIDQMREADVQRCARYTTSDPGFTFKRAFTALMQSNGRNWDKSRTTVKEFEKWMLDAEQEMIRRMWDEMAAAVAMQAYDDDGKTPALGQISSTDGSFGSDLFGAEYGAGGGFRFGNLSVNAAGAYDTGPSGNADNFTYWAGDYANAAVKILGSTNEVFNARMDIALTDGALLSLQKGATPTDAKYLTGKVGSDGRDYLDEKKGIVDTFNTKKGQVADADKKRLVQGHLHFRVVGDDIFEPINVAVVPTVYASTEPLYSFEPLSDDETLFDESTTITVVIIPVTIRGWATFHAGVNYKINASLDRPNIHTAKGAKAANENPFSLNNTIEPYAQIDGNVSVAIGIPGLEVGLKGSLTLIRMGLPYHSSAAIKRFDPTDKKAAGNRFLASQGLDFTVASLSGTVSGFVEILLWEAEAELFHWDGITSTTPIFALNEVDANVEMSTEAVRALKPGFKVTQ